MTYDDILICLCVEKSCDKYFRIDNISQHYLYVKSLKKHNELVLININSRNHRVVKRKAFYSALGQILYVR